MALKYKILVVSTHTYLGFGFLFPNSNTPPLYYQRYAYIYCLHTQVIPITNMSKGIYSVRMITYIDIVIHDIHLNAMLHTLHVE